MQYEMDETNFALMHKEAVFQVSARLNISTALNMLKVNKVVAKKQPDPQIDDVEETVTPDQPSTSTPKSPEVQPKRKNGPKTKVIMCDASTQTDKEQIIELQTDKKKEVELDDLEDFSMFKALATRQKFLADTICEQDFADV